jgi:diaminopimelate epimerase
MSGAGNTFIVIEERCLPEGYDAAPLVPTLCDEGQEHGGADGLIAVAPGSGVDFAMRYFNRDGSTGMMCGNGGRCAVRFAVDHGLVRDESAMTFTNAGVTYRAAVTSRGIRVWFPDPRAFRLGLELDLAGALRPCHYADVGTPHAVMFVDEAGDPSIAHVDDIDIASWGPALRRHERFAPDGANANFVELHDGGILLRTFERGVEAETGACGTGAISSALVTAMRRGVKPPIEVTTTSGEKLWVDFTLDGNYATNVSLEGGADVVMIGEFSTTW